MSSSFSCAATSTTSSSCLWFSSSSRDFSSETSSSSLLLFLLVVCCPAAPAPAPGDLGTPHPRGRLPVPDASPSRLPQAGKPKPGTIRCESVTHLRACYIDHPQPPPFSRHSIAAIVPAIVKRFQPFSFHQPSKSAKEIVPDRVGSISASALPISDELIFLSTGHPHVQRHETTAISTDEEEGVRGLTGHSSSGSTRRPRSSRGPGRTAPGRCSGASG